MGSFLDFYTHARPGWPPPNMIVFPILIIGCCIFALRRGGVPEKIAAIVITSGWLLSLGVMSHTGAFQSVEIGILVVDLVCLLIFIAIALRADRFWPLWVAALQLIGTAGHGASLVDPAIVPRTYAFIISVWAYPMIFLMIVGTWRHRQRLARYGVDNSWSNFHW
jgi:hypothetical protein